MRDEHVVGVAAGLVHAHGLADQTQVLVPTLADLALAAAMPGKDHIALADLHVSYFVAHGDDLAGDFVAHGQGQGEATVHHGQLFAVAQVIRAVPDMQIRVAYA